MTRPAIDHVARALTALRQLDPHITERQVRDLVRCAETSGLPVGRWILECAQVQAAAVRDAMQATARRARVDRREENSETAARIRRGRERAR